MDEIKFNIAGAEELNARLKELSYDVRMKGGRFALRKAAAVVVGAIKQNSMALDDPNTGQKISDNVAMRWNGRLFKRTQNPAFRVGILKGAIMEDADKNKAANSPTPHWRLLEFGTSKMPAKPFFRRAMDENIDKIQSTFVAEYNKSLDRAIKRAAKGKNK